MALAHGTPIGPYSVVRLIGQGGMGEVYQARDTKLDRDVALKVLPEAFTADPDRLARFEREAKVLASLNHPNIGSIYGLEEAEAGTRALVLELIEGPTLADRITQGPLPLDEARHIAKQIAEALEAAHEQSVIHRDLKPANIKVRDDGTVKVLDFGLAKALDAAPEGDPSQSPTLTAAATQMGVIMGTAAYMSPEQARGKPVDKRADIWAFGAVLFEMLTGEKPFPGDDVSQTLARVIDRDPNWDALPVETPAALRQLLRRCIERDPRQRLRDIGEARVALGGDAVAVPAPTPDAPTASQSTPRRPALLAMLAGALVGGLVVGAILWSLLPTEVRAPNPPLRLTATRLTNPLTDMAISPDGTRIAYTAGLGDDGRVFLHDLRDGATRELFQSVIGGGESLDFSPDSEWLAFHSVNEETLYRISLESGSVLPIADLGELPEGLSWGSSDTLVFSAGGRLMRVAATGGTPEPLTTPDDAQRHRWPELLSNESGVLFTIGTTLDRGRIAVASLPSGTITELGLSGTRPRYAGSGHLVFADGNNLRAARFDADEHVVLDTTAIPLGDEVSLGFVGGALYDLSETGTLASAAGVAGTRSLVWVYRDGREEPVDAPLGSYGTPRLSSDDTRLAVDRSDGGDSNIWVRDLVRGTETLVTTDSATDWMPLWTQDDQRVIFYSRRAPIGLYSKAADGTGEAELLLPAAANIGLISPSSWAPDGRTLAVWQVPPTGQPGIASVSLSGTPAVTPLLESRFEEAAPALSPDGRWMAYHSAESGQREIYVQRFPDLGARTAVSTGGGAQPQWSNNGQELFYRTPRGGMMVVPVETEPAFSVLGDAELLFDGPYFLFGSRRTYAVSSDGQRFLMVKVEDGGAAGQRIDLTVHWFEELKTRVPVP